MPCLFSKHSKHIKTPLKDSKLNIWKCFSYLLGGIVEPQLKHLRKELHKHFFLVLQEFLFFNLLIIFFIVSIT